MPSETFRPWGPLPWLLEKLHVSKWSLLGCLSYEDRCLAALEVLSTARKDGFTRFILIQDPPSRYSNIAATKIADRTTEFAAFGHSGSSIETHDLFERTERLVAAVREFVAQAGRRVIFDISSFPKRVFIPILKLLLGAADIDDLIITYSLPSEYTAEPLAEDPEPWRHIPLFAPPFPEPKVDVLLVAIGFEALGLPELLEHDYHEVESKFLFPFPPGPPAFQRTWQFMRKIEAGGPPNRREPIRVNALDVSDAFDHILSVSDNGKRYTILAPYGPKPLSAAMAIYASITGVPVYYTQPRVYNPAYSSGIQRVGIHPECYGYCLRLGGKSLYAVSP
jgi:hypothetical protein